MVPEVKNHRRLRGKGEVNATGKSKKKRQKASQHKRKNLQVGKKKTHTI